MHFSETDYLFHLNSIRDQVHSSLDLKGISDITPQEAAFIVSEIAETVLGNVEMLKIKTPKVTALDTENFKEDQPDAQLDTSRATLGEYNIEINTAILKRLLEMLREGSITESRLKMYIRTLIAHEAYHIREHIKFPKRSQRQSLKLGYLRDTDEEKYQAAYEESLQETAADLHAIKYLKSLHLNVSDAEARDEAISKIGSVLEKRKIFQNDRSGVGVVDSSNVSLMKKIIRFFKPPAKT